jgi:flagellar protein FlaG
MSNGLVSDSLVHIAAVKTAPVTLNIAPVVTDGARARAPVAAAAPAPVRNTAVEVALARAVEQRQTAGEAAAEANRRLAEKGSELTIEFDDVLERMVFRLVDSQTGEVVRQIPSEEVLAIARALADDTSAGVLLRTDA